MASKREKISRRAVGKCFGSTSVGPRGQLVIPVEARKELGMDVGTRLLVFSHLADKGLLLVKVDAVEELIDLISYHTDEIIKMLRNSEAAIVTIENEDASS